MVTILLVLILLAQGRAQCPLKGSGLSISYLDSDSLEVPNVRATFETFLASQLNQSVTFLAHNASEQRQALECGTVDFVLTNPIVFSCLSTEFGLSPLLTARAYGRPSASFTSYSGGVVLVRDDANSSAIRSLGDLRGRTLAIGDPWGLGAAAAFDGTAPNLLASAKQVQMVTSEPVLGPLSRLLDGAVDAAAVPSSVLDALLRNASTTALVAGKVRILNATLFPDGNSNATGRVLPGWALAATSALSEAVREQTVASLLALDDAPDPLVSTYGGWTLPLDYSGALGLAGRLHLVDVNKGTCTVGRIDLSSAQVLHEATLCPSGQVARPYSATLDACSSCPAATSSTSALFSSTPVTLDFSCFCSPCAPLTPDVTVTATGLSSAMLRRLNKNPDAGDSVQCNSSSTAACLVLERYVETVTLVITDTAYARRLEDGETPISTIEVQQDPPVLRPIGQATQVAPDRWQFTIEAVNLGPQFVLIYADGQLVSSVVIDGLDMDCPQKKHGAPGGKCICNDDLVSVGGICLAEPRSVIIGVTIGLAALVLLLAYVWRRHADMRSLLLIMINPRDLYIPQPAKVLGTGSFGVVVLGVYNGSEVAVKALTKPKPRREKRNSMQSTVDIVKRAFSRLSEYPFNGGSVGASFRESLRLGQSFLKAHRPLNSRISDADERDSLGPSLLQPAPRARSFMQPPGTTKSISGIRRLNPQPLIIATMPEKHLLKTSESGEIREPARSTLVSFAGDPPRDGQPELKAAAAFAVQLSRPSEMRDTEGLDPTKVRKTSLENPSTHGAKLHTWERMASAAGLPATHTRTNGHPSEVGGPVRSSGIWGERDVWGPSINHSNSGLGSLYATGAGLDSPPLDTWPRHFYTSSSGGGSPGASGAGIFSRASALLFRNYYSSVLSRQQKEMIREIRLMASLRHRNILTVMGAVMGQEPLLVTELMENGSLYDLLRNDTFAIDSDFLLQLMRDIISGIKFLHCHRPTIIHNDIKSKNVLVDAGFNAKLADFGLSTLHRENSGPQMTGGTPYYTAPEVLRGAKPTPASDMFSFAILMWECISRKEPYEGEPYSTVMQQLLEPLSASQLKRPAMPKDTPKPIAELIKACWDEDPAKRPTAEQARASLDKMVATDLELRVRDIEVGEAEGKRARTRKSMIAERSLLREVFPPRVAEALREGKPVEPESYDNVTIYFSDITGYTEVASTLPPIKVMDMLSRLYRGFDRLCLKHGMFKVETVGDAYLCVGGLPERHPDHVRRAADFAMDAIEHASRTLIDIEDPSKGYVRIRVGLHTGPVVASVVGEMNPRYCLFGDTVNTAARMETNSEPGKIHMSKKTADSLRLQSRPGEYNIQSRGEIPVKGKGLMHTFWLHGKAASGPMAPSVLGTQTTQTSRTTDVLMECAHPSAFSLSTGGAPLGGLQRGHHSLTGQLPPPSNLSRLAIESGSRMGSQHLKEGVHSGLDSYLAPPSVVRAPVVAPGPSSDHVLGGSGAVGVPISYIKPGATINALRNKRRSLGNQANGTVGRPPSSGPRGAAVSAGDIALAVQDDTSSNDQSVLIPI